MIAAVVIVLLFVGFLALMAYLMAGEYVQRDSGRSITSQMTGPDAHGRGTIASSHVYDMSYSSSTPGVYGPFPLSGRGSRRSPETYRKHHDRKKRTP